MNASLENNYVHVLTELKNKIKQAKSRVVLLANFELLKVYWEIGNIILQQQNIEGWGSKIIDTLSKDLKAEFPDMQGLSVRNIKYMRAFSEAYPDFLIVQPLAAQLQNNDNQQLTIMQQAAAQLPWSHNIVLLERTKDLNERAFYAHKTIENNWSKNVLILQIENKLFERQGKAITNFNNTLPLPQADLANEMLKSPYMLDFFGITEEMKEREIENALINHLKNFILELGRGFAYVGNQFNLKVGDSDFYLDLLFYNTRLHCYVVFELKVGEFKPEFAGQLNFYLNAVDTQIRTEEDKPTIGVLLCKTQNKTVIEYALKGINKPLGVADYELQKALPENLKSEIPSIQELEEELNKEIEQHQNPVDARLKAIKDKLKSLKTEEIKNPVNFTALQEVFSKGIKPLCQQLINKMTTEFSEEFINQNVSWSFGGNLFFSLPEIENAWKDENRLKNINKMDFTYAFDGFKKAGPENFNAYLYLSLRIETYWYGLVLQGHNDDQPFIKKMYHQPLTQQDINTTIDLMVTKVLDRIEWMIEYLSKAKAK